MKGDYKDTYTLRSLILECLSSLAAAFLIIFLYFYSLVNSYSGHPWQSIPTNSDILFVGCWCLFSYLATIGIVYSARSAFSRISRSWVTFPLIGSVIFIFSLFFALYLNTVRNYEANSPPLFGNEIPTFAQVIFASSFWAIILFLITCFSSSITFYFSQRSDYSS